MKIIDFFFTKLLSKKFIAFLAACWFFKLGILNQQGWLIITGVYVGLETSLNIAEKLKGKG